MFRAASLSSSESSAPARLEGEQVRLSMSRVITGWVFGSIFFQLSGGPVYASFARQLGINEATFGFLAGIMPLMGFLQLWAARLLEGRVGARAMMLWAGLIGRSLWIVAAALPLLHKAAPGMLPRVALVPAFVGIVVVSAAFQAFTGPSFFVWMSALVPGRVGPSFWAKRHQMGTVAGIGAVLVGGWLADQGGAVKAWSGGAISPLLLYSAILIVAAVCGVADIAAFFGVREPVTDAKTEVQTPLWESFKAPLRERQVRNYLAFTMLSTVGFATTGPMTTLFCLEQLNLSRTQTGMVLTIGPLLGIALAAPMWGRIAKAHGTRPMLRFASVFMISVPLAWLLATPRTIWPVAALIALSGVVVTAYEISNLNFMTRACPHLSRGSLTALLSLCGGTTFALFSTLAGMVVQHLHGWHAEVWGKTLTGFHVIFAFSLLPRVLNALWIAPKLQEEDATPTRDAVREIGADSVAALRASAARLFGREE